MSQIKSITNKCIWSILSFSHENVLDITNKWGTSAKNGISSQIKLTLVLCKTEIPQKFKSILSLNYCSVTNIFYILQSYQISILWIKVWVLSNKTEKLLFSIAFSLVWGCRYILFDVFINVLSTIKLILECHICASIKCICALISWSLDSLTQGIVNSSIWGVLFQVDNSLKNNETHTSNISYCICSNLW